MEKRKGIRFESWNDEKGETVRSNGIFWYGYNTIKQASTADKGTREAGGSELMSVAQEGAGAGHTFQLASPSALAGSGRAAVATQKRPVAQRPRLQG